MLRTTALWSALLAASAFVLAAPSDAAVTSKDPAARGLDVFVHAPDVAAPSTSVPVQVEAYGFPTVVSMVPLASSAVEAVWDPESLGPDVSAAPPPVRVTTDSAGRAHLDVPVPPGDERTLTLLIGVRSGEHQRVRSVEVRRVRPLSVSLYVTDTRVVPGGATTAWVRVTSTTTGDPMARAPVDLTLSEGGVPRTSVRLTTDNAGTAMARVPIPFIDESTWSWDLTARTVPSPDQSSSSSSVALTPREETPGSPRMVAAWSARSVKAGEKVSFTVRVRDAADQPIAGLPVRTWIGPRGTQPPKDAKEWEKIATRSVTDASGEIAGAADAPSTVARGTGTTLRLVARTNVEGRDLEQSIDVLVGYPASSAELSPEAGAVVPGVEQRMLLRVRDGYGKPISAAFALEGDGLKARVTTDAFGEGEVTWDAPVDLGAFRNVGPCAGGVAAAVIVRALDAVPALAQRREPFEICVPVDRDAPAILRADSPLAKAGDRVHVRVVPAKGQPKGPWSLVLGASGLVQARSIWVEDGDKGADVELPTGGSGVFTLSAVSPSPERAARITAGALLVTPRVLPKLSARVAGGRAAPGGSIEVEAEMTDGRGGALPGTVAAVVVDLYGGGSVSALDALDTRRSLCREVGVEMERCDRFVEGDSALEPARRALLGGASRDAQLAPDFDPGGSASDELKRAFGEVLRSLEGAVFEATESPDQLRDVRRRGANGWVFNPELLTLVTAAMEPKPTTPGGEPLALADLFAVDPQVTFDNVARRVTRLKLFRILMEMRAFRHERMLDPEEPALKDPNAILRKLVRDGRIPESLLLDPWGGTIQFTRASGSPIPFLTVSRGFELHAPGPDRVISTGDDVRDPFGRVLRSETPYARAVSEDRIVDARVEMEVGDATISAWESMFNELTGTALGASGMGLSGVGSGGGGSGHGIGLGSVGTIGHGRGTLGIPTGIAFWSRPARTDPNGKVKIQIPLGDIETTWRVALIGVPDQARPAVTSIDVAAMLPLSARVEAGATWIEGDAMSVGITLRNRTASAVRATLEATAEGVLALAPVSAPGKGQASGAGRTPGASRPAPVVVDVPAGGAASAPVRVKALRSGRAKLRVTVRAPGLPEDVVNHAWDVLPPGDPRLLGVARWVEKSESLKLTFDDRVYRVNGAPRIVIERGWEPTIAAALEALDPDRGGPPEAMADAIEVGSRVERWAVSRLGQGSPIALRAAEIARRAVGRLAVYAAPAGGGQIWGGGRSSSSIARWAVESRAFAWAPQAHSSALQKPAECPPWDSSSLDGWLAGLDAEPPPVSGVVNACWDAFVTDAVERVTASNDPVALARAVLALADRPHRVAVTAALVDRLRERVNLLPSGAIALQWGSERDRAGRSVVLAALLRAVRIGKSSAASDARLAAELRVQRDAQGGYGSSVATRSAVRALLSALPESQTAARAPVTVIADGVRRQVEVGASDTVTVPLDPRVRSVSVEASGAPVLARLEQPMLRLWSHPPDAASSPVRFEVVWPSKVRAGKTAALRIVLRHDLGRPVTIDTRIPLPPGVSLAAPVSGVRQAQGVLAIRSSLNGSALPTVLEIPLRFALPGLVTAPEARARLAFDGAAPAIAPARPFLVE